jgi:hypothetical protein
MTLDLFAVPRDNHYGKLHHYQPIANLAPAR